MEHDHEIFQESKAFSHRDKHRDYNFINAAAAKTPMSDHSSASMARDIYKLIKTPEAKLALVDEESNEHEQDYH